MKRQKQIDESKQMIADAFVSLVQERGYEDVTLSQIAERAGVNRMTIYRHFRTKERIVLHQAQQTLALQEARAATEGKPVQELIRRRLDWLKSLPQLPVLMQSRELEELLEDFQLAAHGPRLEMIVGKRYEDARPLYHFYFGGVSRLVREWLRGGGEESSGEIAEQIASLTRAFAVAVRGT